MYMVEITEHKLEALTEHVEKSLKYLGKVMSCLDEMKHKSHYNEHQEEDYDDDEEFIEERYGNRGRMNRRSGGGRYSRY